MADDPSSRLGTKTGTPPSTPAPAAKPTKLYRIVTKAGAPVHPGIEVEDEGICVSGAMYLDLTNTYNTPHRVQMRVVLETWVDV